MIAYNCPLGRIACDGCNQLTTGGCAAKQGVSQGFSITHEEALALHDRRREELMKLSKEDLVELLIGKREHVGQIFG